MHVKLQMSLTFECKLQTIHEIFMKADAISMTINVYIFTAWPIINGYFLKERILVLKVSKYYAVAHTPIKKMQINIYYPFK